MAITDLPPQVVGYVASGLVLGAFAMKDMIQLRVIAICSNVAFIAYGVALNLSPVVALHVILLPMNSWRLWQALRARKDPGLSYREDATKLPTMFPLFAMKLATVIGSLVAASAVAGWLILTKAESNAGVVGLHSVAVMRPSSPTMPTLIPLW